MVAVYTVPVKDMFPLPEGLQQEAAGGERHQLKPPERSPLDRDDLLDQLEKELEEKLARDAAPIDLTVEDEEHKKAASAGEQAPLPEGEQHQIPEGEQASAEQQQESKEGEGLDPPKDSKDPRDQLSDDDPWKILPHRHDELTSAEIRWWDVKDQFWKEKVAELQDVEMRNLTFAVPMASRHSREVVRAIQEVYIRLRTLQLPVLRLHSDRARELTGVKLRDWCTQRDILQTSNAGDESAGNGRCESELGNHPGTNTGASMCSWA